MIERKNKKGISPLIATVLIIGFTIVIAALVITWGTNLFKKTQEATGQQAYINLACTETLGNMDLTISKQPGNVVSMTVDNSVRRAIDGFVVRVYDATGAADTIDTKDAADAGKITPADYNVGGNEIKIYTVNYDGVVVPDPVRVEFRPSVVVAGQSRQCPGNGVTKEL